MNSFGLTTVLEVPETLDDEGNVVFEIEGFKAWVPQEELPLLIVKLERLSCLAHPDDEDDQ